MYTGMHANDPYQGMEKKSKIKNRTLLRRYIVKSIQGFIILFNIRDEPLRYHSFTSTGFQP